MKRKDFMNEAKLDNTWNRINTCLRARERRVMDKDISLGFFWLAILIIIVLVVANLDKAEIILKTLSKL